MITLITDGACKGNPGAGGWACLVLTDDGSLHELGGAEAPTTNNRMELRAVLEGLRSIPAGVPATVVSDSRYVVDTAQRWLERGSIPAMAANADLWQPLLQLAGTRVRWQRVAGHAGHPLNERADTIAQAYAAGRTPPPAGVLPLAPQQQARHRTLVQAIAAQRPAGTTYLSLVNGVLQRHRTWDACQRRVHKVVGARYKKCRTAEDELRMVQEWDVPADALLGDID